MMLLLLLLYRRSSYNNNVYDLVVVEELLQGRRSWVAEIEVVVSSTITVYCGSKDLTAHSSLLVVVVVVESGS